MERRVLLFGLPNSVPLTRQLSCCIHWAEAVTDKTRQTAAETRGILIADGLVRRGLGKTSRVVKDKRRFHEKNFSCLLFDPLRRSMETFGRSCLANPLPSVIFRPVTEDLAFLNPIKQAHPRLRAGWVGRVPGLSLTGDRDQAMRTLRPYHEAAIVAFGGTVANWWRAEQVHGAHVARVPDAPRTLAPDGLPVVPGADGLVTNKAGLVLAIYVADCGAIWLADRRTGAIGLLHSGKAGTAANILQQALALMAREFGTRPADVVTVLGPCIRPPQYEIDFATQIGQQAAAAGIGEFHDCGENTAADISRFYSYRLEKGQTGRMMALLTKDFLP
jgi:copper oxidase (laccase) domain-containing protein